MTYAEKLKDPRWQRRRLEILARDKWSCMYCMDMETTLNVHHLSYHGEPWDAPDEELITSCEHCHGIISSLEKGETYGVYCAYKIPFKDRNSLLVFNTKDSSVFAIIEKGKIIRAFSMDTNQSKFILNSIYFNSVAYQNYSVIDDVVAHNQGDGFTMSDLSAVTRKILG